MRALLPAPNLPLAQQCGVLTIKLARPHTGHLIAALVGLAAGSGAAGASLFVVVSLQVLWNLWDGWVPSGIFYIPLCWCFVETAALVALARQPGRAWFRTRSDSDRTAIIALCWLATAAFVVSITWYIAAT